MIRRCVTAQLSFLVAACNAPPPSAKPPDGTVAPTKDKQALAASDDVVGISTSGTGNAETLDDLERDIAEPEARPEVCATLILDGERELVCCPRGSAFNLESRRCVQLPPLMEEPGDTPPPGFTVRLKELEACTQGPWKESGAKSHGRCEDGKRFFETNGMVTGRTDFYRGEQRVGFSTWSDVGRDRYEGDTGCVVAERVGLCGTPLSLFRRNVFPASPPAE